MWTDYVPLVIEAEPSKSPIEDQVLDEKITTSTRTSLEASADDREHVQSVVSNELLNTNFDKDKPSSSSVTPLLPPRDGRAPLEPPIDLSGNILGPGYEPTQTPEPLLEKRTNELMRDKDESVARNNSESDAASSSIGLFQTDGNDNHLDNVTRSPMSSSHTENDETLYFPRAGGISFPPYKNLNDSECFSDVNANGFLEDENESADYKSSDGGTTEGRRNSFVAARVVDAEIAVIIQELLTVPPPAEDLCSSPSVSNLAPSPIVDFEHARTVTLLPSSSPQSHENIAPSPASPVPIASPINEVCQSDEGLNGLTTCHSHLRCKPQSDQDNERTTYESERVLDSVASQESVPPSEIANATESVIPDESPANEKFGLGSEPLAAVKSLAFDGLLANEKSDRIDYYASRSPLMSVNVVSSNEDFSRSLFAPCARSRRFMSHPSESYYVGPQSRLFPRRTSHLRCPHRVPQRPQCAKELSRIRTP